MMQADWRDKIKTLKEAAKPAENLSAKQQMIRAATRSIKILDDRILQHVVAINELHNRHRMEPGNTKIVNAQMILQTELAKLYKAKQTIVKHRLAIAAEITKFGAADLSLAASGAGEKQEHEQSKDPAKKITDADKKPSWKQILKQKIVAAAATAGVPWVEEDHKRDHGKFAKKDGGDDKKDEPDDKNSSNDADIIKDSKKSSDDSFEARHKLNRLDDKLTEQYHKIYLEDVADMKGHDGKSIFDDTDVEFLHENHIHNGKDVFKNENEKTMLYSEYPKYKEICNKVLNGMPEIKQQINDYNKTTHEILTTHKNVSRGTNLEELGSIADAGGKVGQNQQRQYTEGGQQFIMTSISDTTAMAYAGNHGDDEVLLQFDVSNLAYEDDYKEVTYEFKDRVKTPANKIHEQGYGGTDAWHRTVNSEVHILKDSAPRILSIDVRKTGYERAKISAQKIAKAQGHPVVLRNEDYESEVIR